MICHNMKDCGQNWHPWKSCRVESAAQKENTAPVNTFLTPKIIFCGPLNVFNKTKRGGPNSLFSDLKELVSLPRVTKPVKGFKMSIFKPMYEPHNSFRSRAKFQFCGVFICALYTGEARANYLLSGNWKVR